MATLNTGEASTGSVRVSTKFMESYELIRPVSGSADLTAFLNEEGLLDVYSVGTANEVFRIRPSDDQYAGWIQEDLGITARQLRAYNAGFGLNNPNLLGLNNEDVLTLSTYQQASGRYQQQVSQPAENKLKVKRFLAVENLGNVYVNVILENDEVATSFLKPDGTWATRQYRPIRVKGSTANTTVSRIAMCANRADQTALYAIGRDPASADNNAVLFSEHNFTAGASEFVRLGLLQAIELAVVEDTGNLLNIFAIDTNLHLFQKQEKKYSASGKIEWEEWKSIDTKVPLVALHAVINADELLEIFAVGTDGLLYHTRQQVDAKGKVTGWSTLFPLGNPVPNSIFTVARNQNGYAEAYSVTTANRLYRFWQDPNTTQWNSYEVHLEESNQATSVPTHSVELTVMNQAEQPAPSSTLRISTSQLTSLRVNGLSYVVSQYRPIDVKSTAAGTVAIQRPTNSLSAPTYYITTDFMIDGEGITIEPNAELQDQLHQTSKDDVWNAKDADGNFLLSGEYRTEENADNLAQIMRRSASLGFPSAEGQVQLQKYLQSNHRMTGLRYHPRGQAASAFRLDPAQVEEQHWEVDFTSGAPRYRELSREQAANYCNRLQQQMQSTDAGVGGFLGIDWGDLWNAVKNGVAKIADGIKKFVVTTIIDPVKKVVSEIKVVFEIVIDGIQYAIDKTIEFFQQAFDIIEGIWNKIKVFFKQLYEWLAFLFDWPDIKRSARAIEHMIDQSLDFMGIAVTAVRDELKKQIDNFKDEIKKKVDAFLATVNQQETIGQLAKKNSRPMPALDKSTSHNLLLNSFTENYDKTEIVARPFALQSNDPLQGIVDEMKKLANNFQFGDGKQAFDEAVAYFQSIGDDPSNAVNLVFSGVIKVLEAVALFAIDFAEGIIISILDLVIDLIRAVKGMLDEEWKIPVVSQIYELITGKSLSFRPVEIFALIIAAPGTILYKTIKNEAPFPNSQSVEEFKAFFTAQWLAEQSGLSPAARALTAADAAALEDQRTKAKIWFDVGAAITWIVRVPCEMVQVAISAAGASFKPLSYGVLILRFANSFFATPWIIKKDAGGLSCGPNKGFSNMTWLLQIVFGPSRGVALTLLGAKPEANNATLTLWGGFHLVMHIYEAVEVNHDGPTVARNVLTTLAPQGLRFAADESINESTYLIPLGILEVIILLSYPTIAVLDFFTGESGLSDEELQRVLAPAALRLA